MLVIENLDGATVERAAALVAREQAAARQVRPELPAAFESAEVCAARAAAPVQQRPPRPGRDRGRARGRRHDRGCAGEPCYRPVCSPAGRRLRRRTKPRRPDRGPRRRLREPRGAADRRRCAALLPSPRRAAPLARSAVEPRIRAQRRNGIQPAAPQRRSSAVAVHVAGVDHLETIARLALVEIQHRSAPPIFAPRQDRPLADLAAGHRARPRLAIHCRTRPHPPEDRACRHTTQTHNRVIGRSQLPALAGTSRAPSRQGECG